MSDYNKEKEWSTVSRKKDRKRNNTKTPKRTNVNRKENPREFYQEDRTFTRDRLFQNKSNRRERKSTTENFPKLSKSKSTSTPSVPSGPKWSNLISKDVDEFADNNECEYNKSKNDITGGNFLINTNYKNPSLCVRNQLPKNNDNVGYNTWQITYFKYLIDLYNIFCEETKELQLPCLDTLEAFENFCYFIRDCSSGEISPYVDSIDRTYLEDVYYEYTIKRDSEYI